LSVECAENVNPASILPKYTAFIDVAVLVVDHEGLRSWPS